MKHKKHKNQSEHQRKKSKKKDKKKHKKEKYHESDSSSNNSENEQEWVEKPASSSILPKETAAAISKEQELLKREDWLDIKSVFPCVFKDKKTESSNSIKNANKPDLLALGQSDRELNPYWKDGGSGIPQERSTVTERIIDIKWLKKSLRRAKEQAEIENRSLEEIAAERWGSLEVIQSMIAKAEGKSIRGKSRYISNTPREHKHKNQFRKPEKYEGSQSTSSSISDNSNRINRYNDNADDVQMKEAKEIELLTEAEMNKLGAKIIKAELMGDTELADELKLQLKRARDVKTSQHHDAGEIQNVVLTRTDERGVSRPLEPRSQCTKSTQNEKRKNMDTHVSGKKARHYFDDDKYSLQQLFQKEKGRSTHEDDAEFVKVASKSMDMDEIFEERITHVKSDAKQDTIDRSHAIKEHKRIAKSLDSCHWCIDSKHMLKHLIVTMDSEICLSLPRYTSLTVGHCILTPTQHIACQLQLDENVWEKLKQFKRALYKMFRDRNQYPVFFEIYKSRYKFPHMQLECVPLPKKVGELAPMYFKKALLESETEWSMNKKIIDLEQKDVRHAIPNGLTYFMVEFEINKGYAHVIEDEHMFPKNFAEEIIGGMLDLDHDVWRKPKKQSFDEQREKVLEFSEIWKKYTM